MAENMTLDNARKLLKVGVNYTRDEIKTKRDHEIGTRQMILAMKQQTLKDNQHVKQSIKDSIIGKIEQLKKDIENIKDAYRVLKNHRIAIDGRTLRNRVTNARKGVSGLFSRVGSQISRIYRPVDNTRSSVRSNQNRRSSNKNNQTSRISSKISRPPTRSLKKYNQPPTIYKQQPTVESIYYTEHNTHFYVGCSLHEEQKEIVWMHTPTPENLLNLKDLTYSHHGKSYKLYEVRKYLDSNNLQPNPESYDVTKRISYQFRDMPSDNIKVIHGMVIDDKLYIPYRLINQNTMEIIDYPNIDNLYQDRQMYSYHLFDQNIMYDVLVIPLKQPHPNAGPKASTKAASPKASPKVGPKNQEHELMLKKALLILGLDPNERHSSEKILETFLENKDLSEDLDNAFRILYFKPVSRPSGIVERAITQRRNRYKKYTENI